MVRWTNLNDLRNRTRSTLIETIKPTIIYRTQNINSTVKSKLQSVVFAGSCLSTLVKHIVRAYCTRNVCYLGFYIPLHLTSPCDSAKIAWWSGLWLTPFQTTVSLIPQRLNISLYNFLSISIFIRSPIFRLSLLTFAWTLAHFAPSLQYTLAALLFLFGLR